MIVPTQGREGAGRPRPATAAAAAAPGASTLGRRRGPSPQWHKKLRRKRAAARKLLKVVAARKLLKEHHGSRPPSMPDGGRASPKVLRGSRELCWECKNPNAALTRTGQTACSVCTAKQKHRHRWCARQRLPMPVPRPGRRARDGMQKEAGKSRTREARGPSGRGPVRKALMRTKSERKWQMPMALCCRSILKTWQGSRRRVNRQRATPPPWQGRERGKRNPLG